MKPDHPIANFLRLVRARLRQNQNRSPRPWQSRFGGEQLETRRVLTLPVAVDDAFTVAEDQTLNISLDGDPTSLVMTSDAGDYVGQGQTYDVTPADGTFTVSRNFDNGVSVNFQGNQPGDFWYLQFAAPNEVDLTAGVYNGATRWPFQAANTPGLSVSGQGRGCGSLIGDFDVQRVDYLADGSVAAFSVSFDQFCNSSANGLHGTLQFGGAPSSGGILENDSDADNDELTATLVAGPVNGTLALNSDGTLTYLPDANFNGVDTFTYVANDGTGDSNVATVTITVEAVNDVPVAVPQTAITDFETTLIGQLSATDADLDALTYALSAQPLHGTVNVAADGSFEYIPDATYSGADSFSFTATDGTDVSEAASVSVEIGDPNGPPVAVDDQYTLDEDSELAISAIENRILMTSEPGDYVGQGLTYDFSPANGTMTFEQNINNGVEVNFITDAGSYWGLDFAAANDVELTAGTYSGAIRYPFNDVTAGLSVVGEGRGCNTLTGEFTVHTVEFSAAGVVDRFSADFEQHCDGVVPALFGSVAINAAVGSQAILDNDIDGENDLLTAILVNGPSNGTLTLAADGRFSYLPNANFNGVDTFTYKASDGEFDSNVATVTLTVEAVNDKPIAGRFGDSTEFQTAFNGQLLATDVDNDTLTFSVNSNPSHGTVSLNADGSFAYTPDNGFSGLDVFTFVVNDGTENSSVTAASIEVLPNNPPVANDDAYSVDEDDILEVFGFTGPIGVVTNDTDADGDLLTAILVDATSNGSLSMNQYGEFTYTPNANFNGTDSFTYRATDGFSESNLATVTITVNPIDDAPLIGDQGFSVSEAAADGTIFGTVLATEVDNDGVSFEILSGNTNGVFAIDFQSGELQVVDSEGLNYGQQPQYSLSVAVYDSSPGTMVASATITINLIEEVAVTKFYVADTSRDSMYEYEEDGAAVVDYRLGAGNNSPRGVAADASGNTIWVADYDRWVYVYDADGSYQNKWYANGLSRVEGIATDGADIWIVDRSTDRIYFFDDGASFNSGTHSATSSFKLNSSNRNPRGVTTDGTHLWVVNSAGTDRVFKYTLSGQMVGKWELDSQNGRPEGITIDPTNVDSIWVVDRDKDDVFEYTGGANFSSGSHSADATFELSGANYNPRGIADPPPPGTRIDAIAGRADAFGDEQDPLQDPLQGVAARLVAGELQNQPKLDGVQFGELEPLLEKPARRARVLSDFVFQDSRDPWQRDEQLEFSIDDTDREPMIDAELGSAIDLD